MMSKQNGREKSTGRITWLFGLWVILKAGLLFITLNFLFALVNPLDMLATVSIYNHIVPGRVRLPHSNLPTLSYNVTFHDLDAIFASHEISRPKRANEYRIIVLGDSSTWGRYLRPEQTLTELLNSGDYVLEDGREVEFYNLAYPGLILTKDLLILDYAMRYEPDMIVWLVTLYAFRRDVQIQGLTQYNPEVVRRLISEFDLLLDPEDPNFAEAGTFMDWTLVSRRRDLSNWLRLQLYGVSWHTTNIDQYYREDYPPLPRDFTADTAFMGVRPPQPLTEQEVMFDVLRAGIELAGEVPVLLVNEPIFISDGKNSSLHYNHRYPRWAYDTWRLELGKYADANGIAYLDVWDAISPEEFTDTPFHRTPAGERQLAGLLYPAIIRLANDG